MRTTYVIGMVLTMVFQVLNSSINLKLLLNDRDFYGRSILILSNDNHRKGDNNRPFPDKIKKEMVTSKTISGQQPPTSQEEHDTNSL